MIDKLTWLKNWLNNRARDLMSITERDSPYIWVSSGRVSFQQNKSSGKKARIGGNNISTRALSHRNEMKYDLIRLMSEWIIVL